MIVRSFLLSASLLIALTGCGSDQPAPGSRAVPAQTDALPAPADTTPAIPDTLPRVLAWLARGVDFRAAGNEPFWTLEIDFDRSMRFSGLAPLPTVSTGFPRAAAMLREGDATWTGEGPDGRLVVTLSADTCFDTMSGERFDHAVQVTVQLPEGQTRTVDGCGRYLADPRLAGAWELVSMNGEYPDPEAFSTPLPMIALDPAAGRLRGSTGCENLFSDIAVRGSRIRFGVLTRDYSRCFTPGIVRRFANALDERVLSYRVAGDTLWLSADSSQIRLRRIPLRL